MPNPSIMNARAHPPFDEVADISKHAIIRDHFIGGGTATKEVGELKWVITQVAGDSSPDVDIVGTAAVVQGHPGVISLNTGSTTPAISDEGSLTLGGMDSIILPDDTADPLYLMALVRFPSVASVEFNFGLFDAPDAAGRGVNSVSVELDASADEEFNLVVVDGSSATAVATEVTAAADTWYLMELLIHEHEVQLVINGELAAVTSSANIPDDEGLGPAFKVATEAAGEKSVLIDSFMLRLGL